MLSEHASAPRDDTQDPAPPRRGDDLELEQFEERERRPFTRYECWTVQGQPRAIEIEGETVVVPVGGFVVDVDTDDNRDTGYPDGEYASWTTWARDRAMFDRLIGKSRIGALHDVTVLLDGERI